MVNLILLRMLIAFLYKMPRAFILLAMIMWIIEMAKIVNYAYECYFNGIATEEVNLQNTDAINRSWQNLSQAHKWSNLYHALTWKIKSRSFNFDLSIGVADEQAVVLSEVEHNRWNMEKLLSIPLSGSRPKATPLPIGGTNYRGLHVPPKFEKRRNVAIP